MHTDKTKIVRDFLIKNDYSIASLEKLNIDIFYNIAINGNFEKYENPNNHKFYIVISSENKSQDEICDMSEIYRYISIYYCVNRKYNKMKQYLLKSINMGNHLAMHNLGYYYQFTEINYKKMKKYYRMAIELNNNDSMNNLGYYYHYIEKNYPKMKKYYKMAIRLNNSRSMYNLANYYCFNFIPKKSTNSGYKLALRYYLLAIQYGNQSSIDFEFATNVPLSIKIIDGINQNKKFPQYINSYIKIYKQYQRLLNKKINLISMPFKYAPGEIGFQKAKSHFLKKYDITINNKKSH